MHWNERLKESIGAFRQLRWLAVAIAGLLVGMLAFADARWVSKDTFAASEEDLKERVTLIDHKMDAVLQGLGRVEGKLERMSPEQTQEGR